VPRVAIQEFPPVVLEGSITALATPFDAEGRLDLDAFRRLLAWQLEAGTQGLVVAGSTGEAAALDDDEFDRLLDAAVRAVAGRVPVLAGCGQMNTQRTVQRCQRAAALGADAALVVTPPYVRPTQAGLIAHYRAVAAEGKLPVVLYNVPPRTGCDLLPETVAALVDVPGIVGIKEAVAADARMQALLALRRPGFAVLSGDDPTACAAMLAGADGVISVASNVVPASFRALCDAARGGRARVATALDARLQPVYAFLGVEPNPIPAKALLARRGLGHGLRLPLLPLSRVHHAELQRIGELADVLETDHRAHAAA
jgi:4-hydroxy-tetrahydrodipicolinate synthase